MAQLERHKRGIRTAWKRVTGVILAAGALAGAIGAILALLPDPPPARSAELQRLSVDRNVPLSEYSARLNVVGGLAVAQAGPPQRARARGGRGAALAVAGPAALAVAGPAAQLAQALELPERGGDGRFQDPGTGRPTPTPTPTPSPTATPEPSPTPSPSPTPTPTPTPTPEADTGPPAYLQLRSLCARREDAPPGERADRPRGLTPDVCRSQETTRAFELSQVVEPEIPEREWREVERQVDRELESERGAPSCSGPDDPCKHLFRSLQPDGTENTPEARREAAQRLVEVLETVRTVELPPDDGGRSRLEPLGVVLGFRAELVGLRGEDVTATWSMHAAGTGRRVPRRFMPARQAVVLRAEADREALAQEVWVPLPRAAGRYFLRLRLHDEKGETLARADSPAFR